MTKRRGLILRILADLLVASFAPGALFGASESTNGVLLILVLGGLLLAAGAGGYLEPSAKRVWIHPLVIMSPELIALAFALLTCRGFECEGMIGFLIVASLFTLVLVGLAFAAFYVRRWVTRSSGA